MSSDSLKYEGFRNDGFFLTSNGPKVLPAPVMIGNNRSSQFAELENWTYSTRTSSKFANDKCFYQDDECAIVLEGVILNKAELYEQYHCDNVVALVKTMRLNAGEAFFSQFRGPFSGAFFNCAADEWTVWTNHSGGSCVFYSIETEHAYVGSCFWDVLDALRSESTPTLCEHAVTAMLTYGFMNDNSTYVNQIKRLLPGHYAVVSKDGSTSIKSYWEPKHNSFDLSGWSEEQIISELDARFRHAVDREYGKDDEYGYRHLAALSGGLDSRMSNWVAHDLGYTDVVNITFSQAGYLDETISQEIAHFLGNQHLFMQSDDAGFMLDISQLTGLNYGLTLYSGTQCFQRLLSDLNHDSFGLLHEGPLGVVVGSYLNSPEEDVQLEVSGVYSSVLAKRADEITNLSCWDSRELYLLSTRGFLGMVTSHLTRQFFSPVVAPFLDVDFFDFMLSVPLELRCGHRLYKRWICEKYPEAAGFVWEAQEAPLNASPTRLFFSKLIKRLRESGPKGVLRKILGTVGFEPALLEAQKYKYGMSPVDVWVDEHPAISATLENKYRQGLVHPILAGQPKAELERVWDVGNAMEKILVVTVIEAVNLIWGPASTNNILSSSELKQAAVRK